MVAGIEGGAGEVCPFQKRLSREPAPQTSAALPAQGILQSVAGAFVVVDARLLPQSVQPQKGSGQKEYFRIKNSKRLDLNNIKRK